MEGRSTITSSLIYIMIIKRDCPFCLVFYFCFKITCLIVLSEISIIGFKGLQYVLSKACLYYYQCYHYITTARSFTVAVVVVLSINVDVIRK